jgi:adenylate kinase|tara:strand:+ start:1992 stop:2504 length:513 start_codon:yes stop_codon:yes gene_type:complete
MVRCALTGTPGTGKTSISKLLNTKVVNLSDYYEEASEGKTEFGEWLLDLDKLNRLVKDLKLEDGFYEGHTSHTLDDLEMVLLLRCDPLVLRERLTKRNYSKEKINENLEAEALNIILDEALDHIEAEKIFQLDTTHLNPQESSKKVMEFINGNIKLDETFDYSERIMDLY